MHADERFTGEAGEPTARRHLLLAPRVDGTHRASGVSEINSDGDTHLVG